MNHPNFTMRLPPATVRQLTALATLHGVSRSAALVDAVNQAARAADIDLPAGAVRPRARPRQAIVQVA